MRRGDLNAVVRAVCEVNRGWRRELMRHREPVQAAQNANVIAEDRMQTPRTCSYCQDVEIVRHARADELRRSRYRGCGTTFIAQTRR